VTSILKPILGSLAAQGREDPSRLVCEMGATSSSAPGDPLRWTVRGWPSWQGEQAVGEHETLGGDGSAPCPGEVVSMALAACMDGALRWFADLMEIELETVDVNVVIRGDVRKYLGLDDMPAPSDTGISMRVNVRAAPGQDPEQVTAMLAAAERGSAVLGMLRAPVPIALTMESR
jgi:uncharacterized OsmC-like protein